MDERQTLLSHEDLIHTTPMGLDRIRKNLSLKDSDPVAFCISKIRDPRSQIYREGKNFYCEIDQIRITVNAQSFTIITAHRTSK